MPSKHNEVPVGAHLCVRPLGGISRRSLPYKNCALTAKRYKKDRDAYVRADYPNLREAQLPCKGCYPHGPCREDGPDALPGVPNPGLQSEFLIEKPENQTYPQYGYLHLLHGAVLIKTRNQNIRLHRPPEVDVKRIELVYAGETSSSLECWG